MAKKNTEPKKTSSSTMAKKTSPKNSNIDPVDGRPMYGRGGKYNFPNARMKLIEQDDEKRAFMAKVIENNLVFFNMGLMPVKSDDELCERLNFFFRECYEKQQLPVWEKLCNCIGYDRVTLSDWETGKNKGFSVHTSTIIKKARTMCAAIDAELAQEGKIQPVVYMFRSKNYYGMRDQQDVVVTPNNPLGQTLTVEQLNERIDADIVPEDIKND